MKNCSYLQDLFCLDGQVAIVTGASGTGMGLGRQFAIALARAGADVVICARTMKGLEETERLIHEVADVEVLSVACDVSKAEDIQNVVDATIEKFGKIDILVNNAGIARVKNFFDYTEEDWKYVMDVNMTSMFLMTQACAKHMKEQHYGRIINLGSQNAYGATRCNPIYVTSKGAIRQFTKAVGNDLVGSGINVNSLSPGVFLSEEDSAASTQQGQANEDKASVVINNQPIKRTGKANELDGALIFLASKACSYCVGMDILVDGGITNLIYENPDLVEQYL